MSQINGVVLFVSTASAHCADVMRYVQRNNVNVNVVRLDTAEDRMRASMGTYIKVDSVPTMVVVYQNDTIQSFLGKEKIIGWMENVARPSSSHHTPPSHHSPPSSSRPSQSNKHMGRGGEIIAESYDDDDISCEGGVCKVPPLKKNSRQPPPSRRGGKKKRIVKKKTESSDDDGFDIDYNNEEDDDGGDNGGDYYEEPPPPPPKKQVVNHPARKVRSSRRGGRNHSSNHSSSQSSYDGEDHMSPEYAAAQEKLKGLMVNDTSRKQTKSSMASIEEMARRMKEDMESTLGYGKEHHSSY